MSDNFQRSGAVSNAHVGSDFELIAEQFFRREGIHLERNFPIAVGFNRKKTHRFDLGASEPKIIVECKSHRWTTGENIPSAKMTVWNEAMLYFSLTPQGFRKILFVLHDFSSKRAVSLGQYYLKSYGHLVPEGVEILELNEVTGMVNRLN